MSQILVPLDQFADVVIAWMLDQLNNSSTIDNPNWNNILRKMKNGGIRSNLLQAYIDMSGESRVLYKFVRPILMGEKEGTARITVTKGEIKDEV